MTSTSFLKAACVACLSSLALAGCGGGGGGVAAVPTAAQQSQAARSDGVAGAAVPLVASPAPGDCASGADAPVRNSRLDCAP